METFILLIFLSHFKEPCSIELNAIEFDSKATCEQAKPEAIRMAKRTGPYNIEAICVKK